MAYRSGGRRGGRGRGGGDFYRGRGRGGGYQQDGYYQDGYDDPQYQHHQPPVLQPARGGRGGQSYYNGRGGAYEPFGRGGRGGKRNAGDTDGMADHGGGPRRRGGQGGGNPLVYCRHFMDGTCQARSSPCGFKHGLLRLGGMPKAHSNGIDAMLIQENPEDSTKPILWTGSRDGKLKMWEMVEQDGSRLQFREKQDTNMQGCNVTSLLYAGDGVFVGQSNGVITCFRLNGQTFTLTGHTAPVYALLMLDDVLISGSWDATVRFWKFDAASQQFGCVQSVPVCSGVKAIANHTTQLWVATIEKIQVLDLSNNGTIGAGFDVPKVMDLLLYSGPSGSFMLAVTLSGHIKAFNLQTGAEEYDQQHSGPQQKIMKLAGLKDPSDGQDLLLFAKDNGWITALELPTMNERGSFRAHNEVEVRSMVSIPALGLLFTAGMDGSVAAWKFVPGGTPPCKAGGAPAW